MKKAILYFSTPVELKEFLKITGIHRVEVNQETHTLIGQFTEAELELTLRGFGATTNSLEGNHQKK